ncbi:hypothetical protein B0H16DRAFT_1410269 [Mycena metata]|uniref:AB hydrolase-1 domain-containing protein n=1 Tax=Mycena metata TaxID=1033252 RepID=A0AAD7JTK6_9AGAR|nr:hypothetical protein B0H16DRAFT_1410269 [Mycena metata]
MLLYALAALLLPLSSIRVEASCACSPVVIPVHVNVLVPKDPTDPFAGLKSNASELRRVEDTYDLLVHGFSYTSQYWSPPVEEFRNYSYTAFSCAQGPYSSLAVDVLGAGLSSRPANSSDVQFPTAYALLSQLARLLKSTNFILPGAQTFKTIIGFGHSAGSGLLTFGSIVDGKNSPFDALVLTSFLATLNISTLPTLTSARDVDPLRWASLDPGYLSRGDHSIFYPTDPTSFSSRMVLLDDLVGDVGSVSLVSQASTAALMSGYTGAVAKIVGSADQIICVGNGGCEDVTALTAAEGALWPAVKSFEFIVSQGSGHDMNLDFFADRTFDTFVRLVKKFSDFET